MIVVVFVCETELLCLGHLLNYVLGILIWNAVLVLDVLYESFFSINPIKFIRIKAF